MIHDTYMIPYSHLIHTVYSRESKHHTTKNPKEQPRAQNLGVPATEFSKSLGPRLLKLLPLAPATDEL
jgi:hypothetical protein